MDEGRLSDVLSEFARTLLTDVPIQRILDHLVERIVDVMPISAAGVTIITPSTDPRYLAASDESAMRFEHLQTELAEGPCLTAYKTLRPVAVADLRSSDLFPEFADRALRAGLVAVFAFPLVDGDNCLGALDLYRTTAGGLDKEETRAAQTLADVATAYLVNAQRREELETASQRAHELSLRDRLTGLANRTLVVERLTHAIERNARGQACVTVLFADLDRFKQVNDTFGHDVGDELLVAVADRLRGAVRPGDTLGRLAGDEFALVCEDLTDGVQAQIVAERISTAMAAPFRLATIELFVTMSLGIATMGAPGHEGTSLPPQAASAAAEGLLREADLAMPGQKGGGEGYSALVADDLRANLHRLDLSRDLPEAFARDELRVEYQPIVSVVTQHVVGAEASLRWNHPRLGPIEPAVFTALAERSGQTVNVGRMVLERACREQVAWSHGAACLAGAAEEVGVAVDISAHQLPSVGFAHSVADVLAVTGVPAARVTLEVTESALVVDHRRGLRVISELRGLGVRFTLDHFGTGSSSLVHLRDVPIDFVKIDRSLVRDLAEGSTSRYMVEPSRWRTSWGCAPSLRGWRPTSSTQRSRAWGATSTKALSSLSRSRRTS